MADEFSVDTGALREDAVVWQRWQSRLRGIGEAVPTVGSDIEPLAFSVLPGADKVRSTYASVASRLAGEVTKGAAVMGGVATTLSAVATLYEDAERDVVQSFRL